MSRRGYEKKVKEEQEATARVFKDFLDTFHNPSPANINKTFIKSSVLYDHKDDRLEGEVYKPKPVISLPTTSSDVKSAIECAKILKEDSIGVNKKSQKLRSNLDLLKEELKLKHTEKKEKSEDRVEHADTSEYTDGLLCFIYL